MRFDGRWLLWICIGFLVIPLAGCPKKKRFSETPDLRGSGEFTLQDVRGAGWSTEVVILGDVDSDGDLDAFVGNFGEQNRLLINDGTGEFRDGTDPEFLLPTGLPLGQDRTQGAAFGDVDGDGDLDIAVANQGQNLLLINNGNGEFTDGTDPLMFLVTGLPIGSDDTRALAFVNVDDLGGLDTDLDLVMVNNGQNRLYLNDGRGEFLDGTDLAGGLSSGLPMDADPGRGLLVVNIDPDVSGDTDFDLVILNEGTPDRLYVNSNDRGEFVDATFDTLNSAASLPSLSDLSRDAAAGDLDGDGLLDLVIAVDGENRILINSGAGFFSDATSTWTRERVRVNGNLYAIYGTPPVNVSIFTVGHTLDGAPPVPNGAIRQSPGNGTWNPQGLNVTPSNLYAVWAAPGSPPTGFAAGQGGVVLSDAVGSWTDQAQNLTTVDLFAATGLSASDVYFGGDLGTILRFNGTGFTMEREHTDNDLIAVGGAGSNLVFAGGYQGTLLKGSVSGFAPETTGTSVQISGIWGDGPMSVYAVGTGGTILRYWDQGGAQPLGWYPETTNVTYNLNAVSGRPGGTEIWAAGDYDLQANEFTILRETGSGWTPVLPQLGYGQNLAGIWVDPNTGDVFCVGEAGVVLRWDAVGTTWIDYSGPIGESHSFHSVAGTANFNVAAVGENGILYYFNGMTWTQHNAPSTTENLTGIWFQDATHAWVTGTSGTLYSLDLALWTWTPVSPAPTTKNLLGVWGSASNDVFVVGEKGLILHYDGVAWRVLASSRINAMFAASATNIFAVGADGLILEGDGAGNWTAFANVPTQEELLAVWAESPGNVYAVGRGGTILHYNGASWTAESAPTSSDLHAVWGIPGTVWAGGDQGVLMENSGTGWDDRQVIPRLWVGTTDRITGLWGNGPNDLFAITLSGNLYHFTNSSTSGGFNSFASADSHTVKIFNLNADAFPDIVFANAGQDSAWLNNGFAFFNDATAARMPVENEDGRSLAFGGQAFVGIGWTTLFDLDGDMDSDLIVGNARAQNRLLLNDGLGTFSDGTDLAEIATTGLPAVQHSTAVALGDVTGDGLADAIVARYGQANRLLVNRGGGWFIDAATLPTAGIPADTDPTVGYLDVVFANENAPQRLYLNNGGGLLTEPSPVLLPADVFPATSCALGDLNGDQAPDLVFGTANGQNRVYLQNGGAYTDNTVSVSMPIDTDDTRAVLLADVNGDGAPDIVFANQGSQNRLIINNLAGNGTLEDGTFGALTHLPVDSDNTCGIAAGDTNGDGYIDLVFINRGEQDLLLLNDGIGTFTDGTDLGQTDTTGLPAGQNDGTCGVLVDVDHDGDLDLIVGNAGQQNRLFLNDGAAEFSDGTDEIDVFQYGLAIGEAETTALAV
ncbi:MAG: FG-GAP-like repeat-containing protein, partial [Planctomycetota bacterium]